MSIAKWQVDAYRRVVGPDKDAGSRSRQQTRDPAGIGNAAEGAGDRGDERSAQTRDYGAEDSGSAGVTRGRERPGAGSDAGIGAGSGSRSNTRARREQRGAGDGGSSAAGDSPSGDRAASSSAGDTRDGDTRAGDTRDGTAESIGSDSGRRRQVAVLLNELGREQAAGVLRNLPPSLAEQIAQESLLMQPPSERERAEVMRAFGFTPPESDSSRKAGASAKDGREGFEFTSTGRSSTAGGGGATQTSGTNDTPANSPATAPSWSRAYEALKLAFGPEKADRVLHKAVPEAGRLRFSFLEELDVPQLKTLLSGETEYVVSLVVSQSKPEVAARVLKAVDETVRRNVVARVARMRSLQPEVVDKVAESLKKRWREIGTEKAPDTGGGVSTLAEIMKHLEDKSLLEELTQQEPELGGALRDELYSIDMVLRVNDRQLAEILANFDDHSIALILKGKREEIRAKIMHNVSERRATMVSEEYRELGPQRREDVDEVTHEFVAHLRSRAEDGSLLVDDSDDRYI